MSSLEHETSSAGINVRVTVSYPVPDAFKVADVLTVFRSASWVHYMIGHVVPYLKSSSPAKKEVLAALTTIACTSDEECVICMSAMTECVALACAHEFHTDCIKSWLSMRSTCPTCRYQYQNEFSGRYAFKGIDSGLVVDKDLAAIEDDELLHAIDLGGKLVKAIVQVALIPIQQHPNMEKYPCELKAAVLRDIPPVKSTIASTENGTQETTVEAS
ncbi:Aste57867_4755 [Aphanomyces stellatus]|uniref:Aste57867_4755 protein n=1 Tax=Aphanomyces stellatus TaxID=120398 RepID=A0A485KD75_9STRA|nr:hypothetical protein As57867_004742 [Aphanomyces stellatus]VFT81851.1 Aste57867_4755 [Aphanomyces stellatus]